MSKRQQKIAIIILIVVAVIIVVYMIHMMKVRETEINGGRVFVEGTFEVTLGPLRRELSRRNKDMTCFYLNGLEAPNIVLKRGQYYEFRNKTSEPLYFSTDSSGGERAPGCLAKNKKPGFIGLADGTIFFRVTDDLPENFYYQSGKNPHMGGIIQVV